MSKWSIGELIKLDVTEWHIINIVKHTDDNKMYYTIKVLDTGDIFEAHVESFDRWMAKPKDHVYTTGRDIK